MPQAYPQAEPRRSLAAFFLFLACALSPRSALAQYRFDHWTAYYGFDPFTTSLMNNHYHTEGYLKIGANLGPMMQRIHGSVAKLVNDLLPVRHLPFWREAGRRDYFDGCIRDELQCRRAWRYTYRQSVRAGICEDARDYPHTHVNVELEEAVRRAIDLKAFVEGVPYKRYERRGRTAR